MRIVFDTNVLIAAALKGDFSKDILRMASAGVVTLVCSEDILSELKFKLVNKLGWRISDADFFVATIRTISEIVMPSEKVEIVKEDPDDNKILECAQAGKADLIVSMDQDLLKIKIFEGIGIIHPKTLSWTFPEYFKKKS